MPILFNMKSIIEVNHVSKKYKYGEFQPYYTLRDTLAAIVRTPLQIFSQNKRPSVLRKGEFWALKDISFKLNQGDVLGIIGPNGSGKSTLLKVLSQITPPTRGEAVLRGRVGSLLEVGTGFQQELTGRENIYLNGAILGMKRREINKKFDEIVNFAGVEKFLDTPVKHYSSGMYMRLAFAVAAHLDSEILIVDEVLAVGDAEFQKKSLGKMGEITRNEGRTILFVSHNMTAIKNLCNKAILLQKGQKVFEGSVGSAIDKYTKTPDIRKKFVPIKVSELNLIIKQITINEYLHGKIYPGKPLKIDIRILSKENLKGLGINLMISQDDINGHAFSSDTKITKGMDITIKKGENHVTCLINSFDLSSGRYRLGLGIDKPFDKYYYLNENLFYFDVLETTLKHSLVSTLPDYGRVYMEHEWSIEND